MGSPARGPKQAGGTNFTNDTTIISDEVDYDFNTLYTDYNGNISNVNILGTADISQSKIADHGTQSTANSPGTPGSEIPPTTLAQEIEKLRYILAQLKFGNAVDQGGALEWFERSANGMSGWPNMLVNGSFEVFTGAGSTTAPNGWATTATPATTYGHEQNAQSDGLGRGYRLKITGAASAATGIRQTFIAGALRPSTTYLVYAMAKVDAGGTAQIISTGATTNIDVETTSTTMQLLQGFFTTDATPASVELRFVSKNSTNVTYWDHCFVVPMVATPRQSGYVAVLQQMENLGTVIADTAVLAALGTGDAGDIWTQTSPSANLDRAVVCPGSGYAVRVTARLGYQYSSTTANVRVRLLESTDGGVTWSLRDGSSVSLTTAALVGSQSLSYMNMSPTPGIEYRYKVTASVSAGNITPQSTGTSGSTHTKSFLMIELIPTGGM